MRKIELTEVEFYQVCDALRYAITVVGRDGQEGRASEFRHVLESIQDQWINPAPVVYPGHWPEQK